MRKHKLERGALLKALKETSGALSAENYPDWETPDKAAAWVTASRRLDSERLLPQP